MSIQRNTAAKGVERELVKMFKKYGYEKAIRIIEESAWAAGRRSGTDLTIARIIKRVVKK